MNNRARWTITKERDARAAVAFVIRAYMEGAQAAAHGEYGPNPYSKETPDMEMRAAAWRAGWFTEWKQQRQYTEPRPL